MVIRTIPFPGRPLEFDRNESSKLLFPAPQQGFLIGPENYALEPIVRWAVEGTADREQLPIVFYGPEGSGRSHLLQGIFESWRKIHSSSAQKRRSFFLTASDFARRITDALTTRTIDDFRRRYRSATLLVIDDLNELTDKPWAQDELQHTLDALNAEGGITVFSMSASPAESARFSPSLTARLVGGTTLPVMLPGVAVRLRFLQDLASSFRLTLSEAALKSAAEKLPLSMPGLYGVFAQMYFEATASKTKIDAAFLNDFIRNRQESNRPTIDAIAKKTAKHFSLKLSDLRGKSRKKTVAAARSVAVYLARNQSGLSIAEIAKYFGNRDPSTIRHLVEKVQKELAEDPAQTNELRAVLAEG